MKRKTQSNNTYHNQQPIENFDEDTNSPTAAAMEIQNDNQSVTAATTASNPTLASSSSTQCTITGRKSTSAVWEFATKSDDGKHATCKLCNYTCTSSNHSTSTIRHHLIQKHKKYHLLLNTKASSSSTNIRVSEHVKKELHNLCYNAIITDSRTFNDFRKEGMMTIFNRLMPGYTPPHRNQVSAQIKKLYHYHYKLLKQELEEVEQLALTFDFWSDRQANSFLCATGHWIDYEFHYISKIIDFSCFDERHTGINISNYLKAKLISLNIHDKVISITCDGAENMKVACRHLGDNIKRVWCCAHRLHLVITNALGFWFKEKSVDNENRSSSMTRSTTTTSTVISTQDDDLLNMSWSDENNEDSSSSDDNIADVDMSDAADGSADSDNINEAEGAEGAEGDHSTSDQDDDESGDQHAIVDNWSNDIETDLNPIEELILIMNLLKKCRTIATIVKKSSVIAAFVRKEQLLLKTKKMIRINCKTRWNSTFLLIEATIECKQVLMKLFSEKRSFNLRSEQVNRLIAVELNNDEWDFLSSLRFVLNPFYHATKLMSGKNYPSIGLAFHAIHKLKHFCSKDDTYEEKIKQMKKLLLAKLNYYFYDDLEQHEHLENHSYFDPAAHLTLTENEKQRNERYIKDLILNDVYPQQSSTSDGSKASSSSNAISTSSTKSSIQLPQSLSNNHTNPSTCDDFIAACGDDGNIIGESNKERSKRLSVNEELKYFKLAVQEFNLKNKPSTTTAMRFWNIHHTKLPLLSRLARIHLIACGTSVPSESAFSISAHTARKERSRLSSQNLCYSVFLKDKISKQK
ncbi:unnamed protein product [Rotaria socialis]